MDAPRVLEKRTAAPAAFPGPGQGPGHMHTCYLVSALTHAPSDSLTLWQDTAFQARRVWAVLVTSKCQTGVLGNVEDRRI